MISETITETTLKTISVSNKQVQIYWFDIIRRVIEKYEI